MNAARSSASAISSPESRAIFATDLPLPGRRQGKVRDVYTVPASADAPQRMLIVATDRISAFDVVMPTPITGKGRLLTEISGHWFEFLRGLDLIDDHLISTDAADVPGLSAKERGEIEGRMMLVHAAEVIPVEFVVRGYLAGSGWVEYQKSQTVCGIMLPAGLRQCEKLPEPIFTPATKADVGHDENIDFERACKIAGEDVMRRLRDVSLRIYQAAADYSEERGIILADTKFEFGYSKPGQSAAPPRVGSSAESDILLIDEVLTPDSSRFWPAEKYAAGRDQESFDKQYLRNYLLELVKQKKWAKEPPGPELPADVVRNTLQRYEEARARLFG